ncbi:hypothetical protein RN001_001390 [Aquatica leii]|uniref:Farnesyl pyrophosphate synthase n=1 Tax=Aquatica leii TaxID=1421715 RepID=A0AAN7SL73_9COLE|nr:hypothetical protein RN001_001390 [Aquatica leii]
MFNTIIKTCSVRASRELLRNGLIRNISKSSSTSHTDNRRENTEQSKYSCSKWSRLRRHFNNRALSTVNATIAPKIKSSWVSKEESRDFMAVFPDLVRDLTDVPEYVDIPEVTKRFAKVLQYNVPCGKKTRGLTTVATYKLIEDPSKLSDQNIRLAQILGWCVEMLHGSFLINDDIMDASKTRRGATCWYLVDGVGMQAINDALLLENGVYALLKKHFSDHYCYVPTMELFHEVIMKTSMGQSLDILCTVDQVPQLDYFTMNRYNAIVKYKTGFYSFQLPVSLALYLAGRYDPELHRQATTILLEMGHFYQVQDDFLDCFGDSEVTGKKGTDIEEGKCSWLVVLALQRATPEQKKVLQLNYGRRDPKCVETVRNLYEDLGLPNTYAIYEEESYNLIRTNIQQVSAGLPHKLFYKFLESIYRRDS